MELTILMPCLNEAETVAHCVEEARQYLQRCGIAGEVLVADNGSTDGSPALAAQAGARVIHVSQRGYGAALARGIQTAEGRYVIMGDADCSYDFARLDAFVERLRSGADLVMGNRFQGGIAPGAMPPLHRYLGNPVLSFLGRLFFRSRIGDFHCGLRGFRRDAVLSLGLVTPGMEFASEMVVKASLRGLRVEEVPTPLRPDKRSRRPHLRTWRDGWRHLRFLLLFCPRWLFLYPGLVLMVLGLAGFGALLSFGDAGEGQRVHSLLYMSAGVVLGVQLVELALLTQWMGVLSGIAPEPVWQQRLRTWWRLEWALLLGFALGIGGLFWSISTFAQWRAGGFGPLDPVLGMRAVIPAVTCMVTGMQAVAGALFGAAIELTWRGRVAPTA